MMIKNINLILAGLAFVALGLTVLGVILNDETFWIGVDVYALIVYGLVGVRLIMTRKNIFKSPE